MSVTLSTLVSLAARDGAMLRHDLQDNTNCPPTTRNYLCGQQAVRVSLSAHPPMRKAAAFLTLANARRWRAYSYLVSNACVLYGNAYQAASPALTSYGAESRPCSSPPTTHVCSRYQRLHAFFMRKLCST